MITMKETGRFTLPVQSQIDRLKVKTEQAVTGPKTKNDTEKKLYQACEDFEAIFYQMMMKSMRETINKEDIADGGFGEDVFQGMMDEEVSKQAAKQSGSIADILYQQLRMQLDGKP